MRQLGVPHVRMASSSILTEDRKYWYLWKTFSIYSLFWGCLSERFVLKQPSWFALAYNSNFHVETEGHLVCQLVLVDGTVRAASLTP